MAWWHHRLYAHEFVWTPGIGDGQGGLACCNSWGLKELNTTEMNWNIVEKAAGELSCHVVGNLTNLSRCVPAGLGHWLLTEGSQLIPTADYSDSASFLSFSSHGLSVHYIPALNLGEGLQRWKLKVSALKEKVCCNHSLELSELKVTLENMTFCTCYFIKGIHIHSPHLIIITL